MHGTSISPVHTYVFVSYGLCTLRWSIACILAHRTREQDDLIIPIFCKSGIAPERGPPLWSLWSLWSRPERLSTRASGRKLVKNLILCGGCQCTSNLSELRIRASHNEQYVLCSHLALSDDRLVWQLYAEQGHQVSAEGDQKSYDHTDFLNLPERVVILMIPGYRNNRRSYGALWRRPHGSDPKATRMQFCKGHAEVVFAERNSRTARTLLSLPFPCPASSFPFTAAAAELRSRDLTCPDKARWARDHRVARAIAALSVLAALSGVFALGSLVSRGSLSALRACALRLFAHE